MKKLSLIALALLAVVFTSCSGTGGDEEVKIDKTQLVGRWMTADSTYFEVYFSDGTGKEWDLNDDVNEDEATVFTWEFDNATSDKFIKYYEMETGGTVPQYCKNLELT